ncbi:MAG: hypothetical protein M3021_09895 [Actinomycetota bacterium]|nr:hypothetical protein [Actinomycetota bacterium]
MAAPVIKQSPLHFRRRRLAVLLALLFFAPLAHTARAAGSWKDAGDMHVARSQHTATLLANGQVLVAGGRARSDLRSAEVYDPTTGNWALTGDMHTTRLAHTATLLPNGTVLVAGGYTLVPGRPPVTLLASAELYDPATGEWTTTGSLATARANPTATLLASGKVLLGGGYTVPGEPDETLASAELYDPATGSWTATGSLATARYGHTATLLPNGTVLVAGGYHGGIFTPGVLASAELYDPAAGTWTPTGGLATARYRHTATLLPNGKVLIAGGYHAASTDSLASAEIYDAASGIWTATGSLSRVYAGHTAILLPTGKVLVAADADRLSSASVTATELYDPTTGSWADAGAMSAVRSNATATLLIDGAVLVAGGYYGVTYYASTELYDPAIASAAPVITVQPADKLVRASYPSLIGVESSFSAVARGNPTPAVQWQVSTDNGATFTNIDGASSSTYQFTLDLSRRGDQYRAIFTNSSGSATTNAATLTFTCFGMVRQAIIGDPTVGAVTTSTPTFSWYPGDCVTQYYFYVGSSFGSADLFSSGPLPVAVREATVTPAIPVDGRIIYVRLWSFVYDTTLAHGAWQADDRVYVMGASTCQNGTKADITSPTGASITTGTPTFEWSGGSCVSQFYLYVGSSYRGTDLYNSGPLARTDSSATVSPEIPVNGRTIYVRLWSLVNDSWQLVDHSYIIGACQNPSKADISRPAPGTVHGASQVFFWSGGACVTQYYLYIGSSYGGADVFSSGLLTSSVAAMSVSGLPTNGSTIYLRLWSLVNGTWLANDYFYVSAP